MLNNPMDIPVLFPQRKNKRQKSAFLDAACSYASGLGYPCQRGEDWLRIGPADGAVLLEARLDTTWFCRDTAAVITVLEILRTLPALHRGSVQVLLWAKRKPEITANLCITLTKLDESRKICLIPSRGLMADPKLAELLKRCTGWFGRSQLCLEKSTNASEKTLTICTHRSGWKRPEIPVETHVNILRACISTLISAQ